jgi:hypothetical protein
MQRIHRFLGEGFRNGCGYLRIIFVRRVSDRQIARDCSVEVGLQLRGEQILPRGIMEA